MAGPRIFWITAEEKVIPSLREGGTLIPGEELSAHLTRSLRCQKGDRFSFCQPDSGQIFMGEVDRLSPLSLSLVSSTPSPSLSGPFNQCRFSLAIAPIKGDFLSQTLSQATMCGIDRLIWLSTDRGGCQVGYGRVFEKERADGGDHSRKKPVGGKDNSDGA